MSETYEPTEMLLCRQAVRDRLRRLRLARQCTVCDSSADAGHIGKSLYRSLH